MPTVLKNPKPDAVDDISVADLAATNHRGSVLPGAVIVVCLAHWRGRVIVASGPRDALVTLQSFVTKWVIIP